MTLLACRAGQNTCLTSLGADSPVRCLIGSKPLRAAKGCRRRPRRAAAGARAQLTMPVDPNLSLWQQHAVHSAGLQCAIAIAGSFLAAKLLSVLLMKAANKVRVNEQHSEGLTPSKSEGFMTVAQGKP